MNSPYLNRYRNAEYIQYMTDVLAFLEPHDLVALQLADPQTALVAVVEELNIAFKQPPGSELTPEIVALDDRRDRAISGLKRITESYTYHFMPQTAEAGSLLYLNISKHGDNLPRLGYQEQTAVLSSIIRDWESQAALVAAVSTLGLNAWLRELKTSNAEFAAKYLERVGKAAHNPAAPISELREQGTDTYRKLINHITAHATLSDNKVYTDLLNEIDVLAGKYNQTVQNRSTSNTPTDPEPPTDPTPPTNPEPPTEPNPDDASS